MSLSTDNFWRRAQILFADGLHPSWVNGSAA